MEPSSISHPFPPVFDAQSRILILGSFPSLKSRENGFFYGHPQNRFWKVLAGVLECEIPQTNEEKKHLLLSHGIALWDVIAHCTVTGSSDSSIRDVTVNDLRPILGGAEIQAIYTNGQTADRLYRRYTYPICGREAVCLPSTSPANAAWTSERLTEAWRVIAVRH